MRTGLRLGCSKHDNKETGLRSENNGYLGLFVLGLLALAIPNDVLYTTAQTYYKSCYARGEHMRVTLSRRPPYQCGTRTRMANVRSTDCGGCK